MATNTRNKRYVKNLIFSIVSKVLIFGIGLIIPRLLILSYGSEYNGLLGSITNIYTYIALIEAGIGTVATQALYKPIVNGDKEGISSILVATRNYFRRLIKWYLLAVIIMSTVFPLIVKTEIPYFIILALVFIQGLSHVLTYYFASAVMQILSADGKEYVSQIIGLVVFLLNSVIKIVLVLLQVNIILLQCGYLLVNVIQILIYRAYVYKKYPWINWKAAPNNQALSNRNRFLLNGVAWTVFNSTDTILLSIICGLAVSSIYAIYNLIYANLNMIIVIVYSSSYFVLGQTYHENRNEYFEKHDGIESFSSGLSFALLSIAYVLTLPFITLYTRGIHDVNYVDNWLPLLFCLVQIFSNSRLVCGNLINVCNRPDLVNKASIIEVIINITLSIGLGLLIGIHGVLIATIVALCYKTNFIIIISNKKLLGRSPWHTYKILGPNFIMFGLIVVATYFINLQITSYISLLICALIVAVIILLIFFVLNLIINPKLINVIKGFFGRMKHKKQ